MFSAELRLPREITAENKTDRVETVMNRLELMPYADTIIGSPSKGGLTPDIRKKVTIAVELIMDPDVLFLDEPTTGLSSKAALEVVRVIRRLAEDIPVVCTIHQPSVEIFSQFDWLLLLQSGGEVTYFGPTDQVQDYFAQLGFGFCASGRNVADYAIDIVKKANEKRLVDPAFNLADIFLASVLGMSVKAALTAGVAPSETKALQFDSPQATGFYSQLVLLIGRGLLHVWREKVDLVVQLTTNIVVGFVVGTLWFQQGDGQAEAFNRVSIMFMCLTFMVFTTLDSIPKLVDARPVFFREIRSSMYSPAAYYVARAVCQIPAQLVLGFVFSVLAYFLAGLTLDDDGKRFAKFLAIMYVMQWIGTGLAEFFGTIGSNAEIAHALATVSLTVWVLFTGFMIVYDAIPKPWIFMYYFNVFRYPLSFAMANELENLHFSCSGGKGAVLVNLANSACNYTTPAQDYSNLYCYRSVCPITSGEQILHQFNVDSSEMPVYFGVALSLALGLRLLALIALYRVNHIKR